MLKIKNDKKNVFIENEENGSQMVVTHHRVDTDGVLFILNELRTAGTTEYISKHQLALKYPELGFHHGVNKAIVDALGCSLGAFRRILTAKYYKVHIDPYRPVVDWLAVDQYGPIHTRIIRIANNWELIQQCLEDKQENIIPIVMFLGKTPKELAKMFGKGNWKKLAKNSRSRNISIIKLLEAMDMNSAESTHTNKIIRAIMEANKLPSTILKRSYSYMLVGMALDGYIDNFIEKLLCTTSKPCAIIINNYITKVTTLVKDTNRMFMMQGKCMNKEWSIRRVEIEHAKAVKALDQVRYPTTPYKLTEVLPHEIYYNGLVATLIKSPRDLFNLGTEEHHCVAAYTHSIASGNYAVYVIGATETSKRSVIGIPPQHDDIDLIPQHYHSFNENVTDNVRLQFGQHLYNKIGSILSEKACTGSSVLPDEVETDQDFLF